MLAAHDFEADEIQCRSQYQQEHAKRQTAVAEEKTPAKTNEEIEPEKAARDYCVQRRSVIASERQAEFARNSAAVSLLALVSAIAAVVIAAWAAKATRD